MARVSPQLSLLAPDPNEIHDISVEQLLLDQENPRLAWRTEGNSQEDLVRILWTEMAVDEVVLSIAENGFFRSEPLFVISAEQESSGKPRYIVIEGNRRLAAVMLLRNDQLRKKIKATNMPEIGEADRAKLDTLPAIVYPDRESLWTSIGFRHINGIKEWDSFSKAKYIADVHEKYNVDLIAIAQKIGDRHATVKRLYRGYKLLEQAELQAGFDKEDRSRNRFYFSHLYTAADQPEFQRFLGIDPETSLARNPVPESKLPELAELMTWLYGRKSRDIEPIVRTQNPDLNTLRNVIGNSEAVSALRRGYSLERSNSVAIGDKRRFREALTSAKVELQNAKATVTTGYEGEEDLYDTVEDTIRLAETIRREMEGRREDKLTPQDRSVPTRRGGNA